MRVRTTRESGLYSLNVGRTPVRILLARHGETVFNVEGRWQGQSDSPLTERGRAQARELGLVLADEDIAAIYSSDLGRAVDTAAEVARHHRHAVQTDTRLREIDVGAFARLSGADVDDRFPGLRARWSTAPATVRLPGGENLAEAQARALAFFEDRMLEHSGQTVVVIAHGALGQTILVHALGGRVEDLWLAERIDNCQISRLEWTAETGLRLVEMADVRHLESVGSLRGWRTTDPDPDPDPDLALDSR